MANFRRQTSILGSTTACPSCGPGVTYNSVVEVADCTTTSGVATTNVEEGDIVVGTQLESTSGNVLTNLPTGSYRLSNNLTDGQTYNLGNILTTTYIIQVDNNGTITSLTPCST